MPYSQPFQGFLIPEDFLSFGSFITEDSDKIRTPQGIVTSWQSTGKATFHKTLVDCSHSPFDAVRFSFAFVLESSRRRFATWCCTLEVNRPRTGFNGNQCPEKVVLRVTVRPGDNAVGFVVAVHYGGSFPYAAMLYRQASEWSRKKRASRTGGRRPEGMPTLLSG
jgi:hypothetical protein